jgi:hypothetical protein
MTRAIKGDLKAARLVASMAARYYSLEVLASKRMECISESEAQSRFGRNYQEYLRNRRNRHER